MSPDRRFLYAAVRGEPKIVAGFAIDQSSGKGKLTKLAEYPMGKNPNWIEIVDLP